MTDWFGASWATVGWVAATTAAIYWTTVVAVRLAGRRTVAQLSAFDVVVTIALGSVVATTAVSRSASYAQGATAIATLLGLQVVVGAVRRKYPLISRFLEFPPEVLVRNGETDLPRGPLGPQLTMAELRSQLRERGVFDLSAVALVVMEPTGKVSVSVEQPGDGVIETIPGR